MPHGEQSVEEGAVEAGVGVVLIAIVALVPALWIRAVLAERGRDSKARDLHDACITMEALQEQVAVLKQQLTAVLAPVEGKEAGPSTPEALPPARPMAVQSPVPGQSAEKDYHQRMLQAMLEEAERKLAIMQRKAMSLEETERDLSQQLRRARKAAASHNKVDQRLREELASSQEQLARSQAELAGSQAEAQELRQQLDRAQAEVSGLQLKETELQQLVSDLLHRLGGALGDVDAAKEKLREAETKLAATLQERDEARRQADEARQKVTQVAHEVLGRHQAAEEVRQQVADATLERDQARREAQEAQQALAAALEEAARQHERQEHQEQEQRRAVALLTAELQTVTDSCARLTTQLQAKERQLLASSPAWELAEARAQLAVAKQQLAVATQQLEARQAGTAAASNQQGQLEQAQAIAADSSAQLQRHIAQVQEERAAAEQQAQQVRSMLPQVAGTVQQQRSQAGAAASTQLPHVQTSPVQTGSPGASQAPQAQGHSKRKNGEEGPAMQRRQGKEARKDADLGTNEQQQQQTSHGAQSSGGQQVEHQQQQQQQQQQQRQRKRQAMDSNEEHQQQLAAARREAVAEAEARHQEVLQEARRQWEEELRREVAAATQAARDSNSSVTATKAEVQVARREEEGEEGEEVVEALQRLSVQAEAMAKPPSTQGQGGGDEESNQPEMGIEGQEEVGVSQEQGHAGMGQHEMEQAGCAQPASDAPTGNGGQTELLGGHKVSPQLVKDQEGCASGRGCAAPEGDAGQQSKGLRPAEVQQGEGKHGRLCGETEDSQTFVVAAAVTADDEHVPLVTLRRKLAAMSTEYDKVRSDRDQLVGQIHHLQSQMEAAQKLSSRRDKELALQQGTLALTRAELESQINTARVQGTAIHAAASTATAVTEKLEVAVEVVTAAARTLGRLVGSAGEDEDGSGRQGETGEHEASGREDSKQAPGANGAGAEAGAGAGLLVLERVVESLSERLAGLQAEAAEARRLRDQLTALQLAVDQLTVERAELQQVGGSYQSRVLQLEGELASETQLLQQLQAQYSQSVAAQVGLEGQMANVSAVLASAQAGSAAADGNRLAADQQASVLSEDAGHGHLAQGQPQPQPLGLVPEVLVPGVGLGVALHSDAAGLGPQGPAGGVLDQGEVPGVAGGMVGAGEPAAEGGMDADGPEAGGDVPGQAVGLPPVMLVGQGDGQGEDVEGSMQVEEDAGAEGEEGMAVEPEGEADESTGLDLG